MYRKKGLLTAILCICLPFQITEAESLNQPRGEQVTYNKDGRLFLYENENGKFLCEVYDAYGTIPRYQDGLFKFSLRTTLKLKNLFVLRNTDAESMLGPLEYFGTLARPEQYAYHIEINNDKPLFYRHLRKQAKKQHLIPLNPAHVTTIQGRWHSSKDSASQAVIARYPDIDEKMASLFEGAGVFETTRDEISLKAFDARGVDLSSFKVKLVKNDTPFTITQQKEDPMEVVTYHFGSSYADRQVKSDVGVFLETHDFTQTMTPLNDQCGGFIMLGRKGKQKDTYDLIGVTIPFGYTLVVSKDAIHGDTTLKGKYLMSMTANHVTMQTADVVFLKDASTLKNTRIIYGNHDDLEDNPEAETPHYIAAFRGTNSSEKNDAAFDRKISEYSKRCLKFPVLLPIIPFNTVSAKASMEMTWQTSRSILKL